MNVVHIELSKIMGERRLKISKVSKDTHISRTTLTKLYYSEASGITFQTAATLCKYLECTLDDLVKFDKEEIV